MIDIGDPSMGLIFEGRDAKELAIHLSSFCSKFKQCPTDAAHQLYRNLSLLADKKAKQPRVRVVTSIRQARTMIDE